MVYASVCAGIEAASVAWEPLGWTPAWFAEIDPHACAVLEHRFPNVENLGDITKIDGRQYRGAIDVLVGGTPCQSFSVAGLRKGLDDDRGNLAYEFLRLAQEIRPRWIVWENVPGVLSATSHPAPDRRPPDIDLDGDDGPRDGEEVVVVDRYESEEDHAFLCFLAGLSELGFGYCWRTLDAQFFRVESHPRAVPQRRRRVFVVGHLGTSWKEPDGKSQTSGSSSHAGDAGPARPGEGWRLPAAVLFEREGLSWHPPPSRKAGKAVASLTASGVGTCGAHATGRGSRRLRGRHGARHPDHRV
ncbi:MAG: DNA (cytosine-5-)-methyltransferase [Gemmatimonadetes bacterium]|nr:DNA (cytosine-5-)-methyltransferase [Gemmatimonadota bacterium]